MAGMIPMAHLRMTRQFGRSTRNGEKVVHHLRPAQPTQQVEMFPMEEKNHWDVRMIHMVQAAALVCLHISICKIRHIHCDHMRIIWKYVMSAVLTRAIPSNGND